MPLKSDQKPIFHVTENDAGQRLDNYLIKQCKQLEKSQCYKLIRKGQIRVNGKRAKPLHKLEEGDQIRVPPFVYFVDSKNVKVPEDEVQALKRCIIHEDANFLVIDKPAGLPVHTGTGHEFGVIEIVNAMDGLAGVQLAHRIDKDTSGCLLLAKNRQALLAFQTMMKQHQVGKTYTAVLDGVLKDAVTINQPLDIENRVDRKRTVVVSPKGKPAETRITPLEHTDSLTRVSCRINSGRTHQIRVHAQFIGKPVLGDEIYGKPNPALPRNLYLHAAVLQFAGHRFESKIPVEFDILFP